ncbi:MAG: ArsR family transcriptional regulator [Verrucomicrobiota bacterium]
MSDSRLVLVPTLWRTCRALANRRRLRILRCFGDHPELSVSDAAGLAGIAPPLASEYLRALNARGILQARRVSRHVLYRMRADPSVPHAEKLLAALRTTFRRKQNPVEETFAALTGFTHPRRISIVQALACQPLPLKVIRRRTGICAQAALRHLRKLRDRGYVAKTKRFYRCVVPASPLRKALLALALKA